MKHFIVQTPLKLAASFSIILLSLVCADAAGVLDRAFGTNGTVTTAVGASAQATAMKIQPDGKILVLGTVGTDAARDTVLVRYNPNGSLDTSFGNGSGKVVVALSPAAETANELALQPDGKILVAGSFFSTATQSIDFLVARFNANGSIDTNFGNSGVASVNQGSTDIFHAIVVQPDGRIIAVGRTSDGDQAMAVRLLPNGAPDTSFANGGFFYYSMGLFSDTDTFRAVALTPNGRILIGGTIMGDNGGYDVLMMLEPNGVLAQDFGYNGIRLEYFGTYNAGQDYDLAVLPDGKILTVSYHLFRRLLSNGLNDTSFRILYTPFDNIDRAGSDLAVRSDGRILVLNQGGFSSGHTMVYNNDGRDINRARFLSGVDIKVQSDDKLVIIDSNEGNFIVKRFVSINSPATRIADFDFDDKTDLIFSRVGEFVYVLRGNQSAISYRLNRAPNESVRIIPEDFYNRPDYFPLFYWRYSSQNNSAYFEGVTELFGVLATYPWGMPGDIPVGGDYDGERRNDLLPLYRKPSELAVFRPSTGEWWIYNRFSNSYFAVRWGANGDRPVPADYDYDGITDTAIYRPSTGEWWIRRSSDGSGYAVRFGLASDIPLTGDFDGDGKADLTVYRASEGNWYQLLTSEGFRVTRFGLSADHPAPGDYDGDGKHDIAVFREGIWYLLQSTEGFKAVQWGTSGDSAVTIRYDRY